MANTSEVNDGAAYLVIRQGGRWTDVFRLTAGKDIVIGRSSQAQIVIRSDQCSRAHARISKLAQGWSVTDLGSRNGTHVNGIVIKSAESLNEGDVVSVAGCHMTFVHSIATAFAADSGIGRAANSTTEEADSKTVDQIDPTVITERRQRTSLLDSPSSAGSLAAPASVLETTLFRTAFELARSQTPEQAATTALEAVTAATQVGSGAILVLGKSKGGPGEGASAAGMTALAMVCRSERSYRRVTDKIATTVLKGGEAILARNIVDDMALASPDSRGQWSTTSTLCAPIRVNEKVIGILHVYSFDDEPELRGEHLEIALAVAANLGLALEHLWHKRQLTTHLRRSQQQVAQLREQLGSRVQMVGQSPAITAIESQVARVAPTGSTVLIRGESGVGKELIAAAIHYASPRREGPFICLNCAALSPSLLESELFGHEKGSFTGATERKIGKFEAADGGTLMLDEIGEMSPDIQAKFLRVLEGQTFERVGGNTPIRTDVRVVAATNRNLEEAVQEGKFRSDLFFRLAVLELRIPPLRQRGHDILLLAEHFLDRFNQEMGRRLEGLTPSASQKLLAYDWPGNIRELKNTMERAVVLSAGPLIDDADIWLSELRLPGNGQESDPNSGRQSHRNSAPSPHDTNLLMSLAELEQKHIESVMRYTDGNKSHAAKILGIERSTLDRKLKRADA